MTHEEIIAAREAFIKRGFWPNEVMWGCWRDAWDAGVEAQRERCAKIVERYTGAWNDEGFSLAAAIRKGEKESLTVEARKPVPEFELIEKWEGE
jgi:hypothetical protein